MRKRLDTFSDVFNLTMFQLMILIFLIINIVPAKSLTTHATPDIECRGHSRKYKTLDPDGNPVCVPCSSCSPGYGVLRPCTEYQDTVCEACEPGKTFSGTDSTWRRCESCVQCATHELRRRECTPTRNGRCGSCETGWFHNDITGDCDVCSWCYPEYPAITDFVSGCNVTGVTPGFQCAPILDAPYPPPLELHLHVTTEKTSHRKVEAQDHHHLIGYVGEEVHSLGANEELEKSTHCTPTKSPSFAIDITTEHLIDSVAVLPIRTLNTLPTTASDIQCRGHGRKYKTVDSDGRLVCKNCSKCPPGQGVSVECTEYADTVCEPCVAGGTFSGTSSSWRRCEPCSVCATHELTKRECTPNKNRKCGICVIGYFYDDITGDCDRCSWCFPEYPNIADHQDECDVTGVKSGFQCGPIIDPPYPPPLGNMEHSTLAKD
ncbi:NGFR [Branchiostoma lanceolatum]|uniref:NGFR protein n=1 Tax=Branchiostoma lanceolatum TaxID=7740 RepID=A0A8K0EUS8_BRALA|nr:NGFR [Branchiostoma lanceolatum]